MAGRGLDAAVLYDSWRALEVDGNELSELIVVECHGRGVLFPGLHDSHHGQVLADGLAVDADNLVRVGCLFH